MLASPGAARQPIRSVRRTPELELVNDELAATNAALARRAAELARSNEELAQFASIASHDLQEPLRKVRTFTEQVTVTRSRQPLRQGARLPARANAAAERMQNLIEDLLRFSRVSTHARPFAPVDLGAVTAEVLEDLEVEVERAGRGRARRRRCRSSTAMRSSCASSCRTSSPTR